MSTIKFEKGKFYKTRCGEKVECVHTNVGGTRPLLFATDGEDFFSTNQNGSFYRDESGSEYDIISEWHEERVVWVVCSGFSSGGIAYGSYPLAGDRFAGLLEHPANSLTRVVIQDGHIDKE